MEVIVNSLQDKAFLELLFAGFLTSSAKTQAACKDALHCWAEASGGEDIIPPLQHYAELTKNRTVKFRALLLADRIKSGYPAERDISVQDVLLLALATNSPLLHEKAYQAAVFLPDLCGDLVSAAVDNRKNAACCIRFLKAAKATGGKPGSEWMNLFILGQMTKNPGVRFAAADLLDHFRPR